MIKLKNILKEAPDKNQVNAILKQQRKVQKAFESYWKEIQVLTKLLNRFKWPTEGIYKKFDKTVIQFKRWLEELLKGNLK